MKTTLLALLALVATMLTIPLLATPATAAVTCDDPTWRETNWTRWVVPTPGADPTWDIKGSAKYKSCSDNDGNFAKVLQYNVRLENAAGGCNSGEVEEFKVDPNALGWWAPPAFVEPCNPPTMVFTWQPPGGNGVNVFPSDPRNEQCIGSVVEADIDFVPESPTITIPQICWFPA